MTGPGIVVWFTGLPSSGKTTVARAVREQLKARGYDVCSLDGDEVRRAIPYDFGYDELGRGLFYDVLAGMAALLARQGHIVLVAATAHLCAYRRAARAASPAFLEVYVATPLSICKARDPKSIYAAAARGDAHNVPGMDAPYEPPENPDVIVAADYSQSAIERIAELATLRAVAAI
jgi:adenylylsulfate kinase